MFLYHISCYPLCLVNMLHMCYLYIVIKKNMIVPKDRVVVRVKSEYKEKLTHGSLELEVSESFAPFAKRKDTFAQTYGEIIAICDKRTGGLPVEVEVGDKVYFHFNAINANSRLDAMDDKIHHILYDHLFCAVRDGNIVMLNSRVLCEPLYEEGVENGVRTKNGLVVEINVGHDSKRAVLRHIGNPPEVDAKPGDIVHYEKNADFENIIEGTKYFVMFQDDLIAVENED